MKKLITKITLITIWTMCSIVIALSQVLPEENYAFVFRDIQYVNAEVDLLGESSLDYELDYEDNNDQDFLKEEIHVRLVYNRDQFSDKINNYWSYGIDFNLKIINPSNGLELNLPNVQLSLNSQQASAIYEDVIVFDASDFGEVDLQQLQVTINSYTSNVEAGSLLPNDIQIRLYHIRNAHSNASIAAPSTVHYEYTGNDDHTLNVSWDDDASAATFEMEYAYYHYEENQPGTSASSIFSRAVKVETEKNFYPLDVTYPKGKLFVRHRIVHKVIDSANEYFVNSDWSAYITFDITDTREFETDKNWQYNTTFAEEGKFKKVLTYFDQMLKPRQTQTYINSEDITLVAEQDYDLEGRSTIQILPVPVDEQDNNLLFKSAFNKNETGVNYSLFDHEKELANSLSSASGAGKYYSSSNDTEGIHRDLIPDAEGYPLSQMKYKRDNTGRGVSQGGVGYQYQLGFGKETRMLYTTPTERELRRLFGTEVGVAKYYKKNIVIDPNGQASASYIDMSGKVIATSLIGEGPVSLLEIDDEAMTGKVTGSATHALTSDESDSKYLSKSVNVIPNLGVNQVYTFEYKLDGIIQEFEAQDNCKICRYELEIYISDTCDEIVAINSIGSSNYSSFINDNVLTIPLDANPDPLGPSPGPLNCNENLYTYIGDDKLILTALFSQIGEYKIHKTLIIKPFTISEINTEASTTIDITQSDLQEEIFNEMDQDACLLTCDEYCYQLALESLGTNASAEAIEAAVEACISSECDQITTSAYTAILNDECSIKLIEITNQIDQLDWIQDDGNDIVNFDNPPIEFSGYDDATSHFLNSATIEGIDYNDDGVADPGIEIYDEDGAKYVFYVTVNLSAAAVTSQRLIISATNEDIDPTQPANITVGGELDTDGYSIILPGGEIFYPRIDDAPAGVSFLELIDKENHPGLWQSQFASALKTAHREYCHLERCIDLIPSAVVVKKLRDQSNLEEAITLLDLGSNATFETVIQILTGTIPNSNDPPYDPFYGTGNGNEEICSDVTITTISLIENFEQWFEHGAEGIQAYNADNPTAQVDENLYGILEMLELEGGEDMQGYSPETMWYLFINIYQWIKEKALYECLQGSDCEYLEEEIEDDVFVALETAIWTTNRDAWEVDDFQEAVNFYLSLSSGSGESDLFGPVCEAQVESWQEIYQSSFPYPVDPLPQSRLEDLCQEIVSPFDEGSCMESNRPLDFNVKTVPLCSGRVYFLGNAANEVIEEYNSNNASIQLLPYNPLFNHDGNSNEPNCYYGENRYEMSFLVPTNGVFHSRIIVHTNNCEGEGQYIGPDPKEVNISVYNANNDCNLELLECKAYPNVYGDLVVEYDSPSEFVLIKIGTTSKDNDSPIVRLMYFKDYQQQFIDQNTIRLRAFDFLTNDFVGTEEEQLKVLNAMWPSDEPCGEINGGLNCIFESLIDADFDLTPATPPVDETIEVLNISGPDGCFSTLKMFYYKPQIGASQMWLEISGSSIFPDDTKMWFLTEDLTPNLFQWGDDQADIALVTYGISKYNYADLDPYILNGYEPSTGPVQAGATTITPNIQLLFKILNSSGKDRFIRAYPVFENKLVGAIPEFVEPCTFPFDPTTFYEDCIGELNSIAAEQAEDVYNELIDEKATILLEEIDCKNGADASIVEKLTSTYTQKEEQFTLYYYDQAGNLIQTVPPAGVMLIDDFNDDGEYTGSTPAEHKKVTTYAYNSFNQITTQTSPDAGTSMFVYDDIQRIRFSQNAKQDVEGQLSYTKYDGLSRPIEVGEFNKNLMISDGNIVQPNTVEVNDPNFPGEDNSREEFNKTYYTTYDNIDPNEFDHGNIRGKIAKSERYESAGDVPQASSYFAYDAHGNVNHLRQEILGIDSKDIYYSYDLVSGNVHEVAYNPMEVDAYYHRYQYDADNRITQTFTSENRVLWEEDAHYEYYKHGPLARVELGNDKVQGCDYAYTLQGWIKKVNEVGTNSHAIEIGKDGHINTGNQNQWMARDAMSYGLEYNSDDYFNIGGVLSNEESSIWNSDSSLGGIDQINGLYNGNIAGMMTDLKGLGDMNSLNTYAYKYDQLHRIKNANSLSFDGSSGSVWSTNNVAYNTSYTYDRDGNLSSLNRNSKESFVDALSYTYGNTQQPNILTHIDENQFISDDLVAYDIDDQSPNNYKYDAIGNLEEDVHENTTIEWDVYNKVKEISRPLGNTKFIYDPMGNRVAKITDAKTDFYIRDASGNVMSIYSRSLNDDPILKTYIQKETSIYGSSRVGSHNLNRNMVNATALPIQRNRAVRSYELSNHLGNVLTTVTDRKLLIEEEGSGSGQEYYTAEIASTQDFYPFGMQIEERTTSLSYLSEQYRYGFNGKEKDEEGEWGSLTSYDYGFRIYNPGIGKFLSVDPLTKSYPMLTPYQFASNSPILGVDLDGKEFEIAWNILRDFIVGSTTKLGKAQMAANRGFNKSDPMINSLSPVYNKDKLHNMQFASATATIVLEPARIAMKPLTFAPGAPLVELMMGQDIDGNAVGTAAGVFWVLFDLATLGEGKVLKSVVKNGSKQFKLYLATSRFEDGKAIHSKVGIDDITNDDNIVWFDQSYDNLAEALGMGKTKEIGETVIKTPGIFERAVTPHEGYTIYSLEVSQDLLESALKMAKDMDGKNVYNIITNSCTTCARRVLNAGGQNISPLNFTPAQLEKAVSRKNNSSLIQESTTNGG